MIAITPTVLNWYRQRIAPPLAIFKEAESKQRRISIHEIINLNAGGLTSDRRHEVSNTLAVLKLRRERSELTLESLRMMRDSHYITSRRIARAWERANKRGK